MQGGQGFAAIFSGIGICSFMQRDRDWQLYASGKGLAAKCSGIGIHSYMQLDRDLKLYAAG